MNRGASLLIAGLGWVLLTVGVPAPAGAVSIELEARLWGTEFDGVVSARNQEIELGIDLGRDLPLDSDDVFEGRLTFRPGLGLFVRASYLSFAVDGSRDLDLEIGGIPLTATVSSGLDLDYGRLALGWQFVAPSKMLRIGPYVEAKGFQGDASISVSSPFLSASASEGFETGFAAVGALFDAKPTEKLQLFAEGSVVVAGDDVDIFDAEFGIRYFPVGLVGVGVGYRLFEVDGDVDNVRVDLDIDGFFFTVGLSF